MRKCGISRRAENLLLRCRGAAVHYAPHAPGVGFQRNTFLGDLLGAALSRNQDPKPTCGSDLARCDIAQLLSPLQRPLNERAAAG